MELQPEKVGEIDLLQEIYEKLIQLEDKVEGYATGIIPVGKCYTSKQVEELLQISDVTLGRMRAENRIVYKLISDNSYRYPVDQPIFKTKK
jgi:hypothetical protein